MQIVRYRVPDATAFNTNAQADSAAALHSDHGDQAGYSYEARLYTGEGWFVLVRKADGGQAGWLRL